MLKKKYIIKKGKEICNKEKKPTKKFFKKLCGLLPFVEQINKKNLSSIFQNLLYIWVKTYCSNRIKSYFYWTFYAKSLNSSFFLSRETGRKIDTWKHLVVVNKNYMCFERINRIALLKFVFFFLLEFNIQVFSLILTLWSNKNCITMRKVLFFIHTYLFYEIIIYFLSDSKL